MRVWHHYTAGTLTPFLRGQKKAPLEQIKFGPAKHLALQHLEAVDVAFNRVGTPREGDPGFDGVIVVAESLRKPL